MSKKQITTTIVAVVTIIILLATGYYILNKQDKNTTLTLLDKQWIEANKNKVFDFSMPANLPLFNLDGEGIIFDFLNDFSTTTKLSFNKTTYTAGADLAKIYSLKIVDKKNDSDLLIYQDHYVLLTNQRVYYASQADMTNLTIGVLEDNVATASKSLADANVKYVAYNSIDKLLSSLASGTDAIVLPRVEYLENIMLKDNLYIAYNIYEMTEDYVISLGDNAKLNSIVTKYFNKWYKDNFNVSYNKHFTANYFSFNEIDSKTKAKFRSKRYTYGLISNLPYDNVANPELTGINSVLLHEFAALADIEISYTKYANVADLVSAFSANKLDLFYNISKTHKYDMDVITTPGIYTTSGVVLVPYKNKTIVTSLNSLQGIEVLTIKDSQLEAMVSPYAKIKPYANINELLNAKKSTSIIAIDYDTYQFYKNTELSNYLAVYTFDMPASSFNLRDIANNEVFNDYFMLYLAYANKQGVLDTAYQGLLPNNNVSIATMILNIGGYALFVAVVAYEVKKKFFHKGKRKEVILSKADKLKYIDMLTSLKNRNYLNDNIDKWDNRDIYPQAIIMIDLNNIAYVNDNFGYQEGDKVIIEAANILINNQVANSDIIRTNGNEFLVYVIGYEEKQVVLYMRKLNRELKELTHGYGAAVGYSMIADALKTVDDAINEATMDMRTNKEEASN